MSLTKRGFRMNISEEMLYFFDPLAPQRYVDHIEGVPLTEEQIRAHDRAKLALDEIENNEWIESCDEWPSLKPLEPKKVTHYAESYEAWLERCRADRATRA